MGRLAIVSVFGILVFGATPAHEAEPDAKHVPYRLTTTRHVLVRAKINGQGPYNLVLDTGAPVLILAKKLAEPLKIDSDTGGWSTLDKFELEGGVVLQNTVARFDDLYQLEGMNGLGLAGVEIHGLVGYPILAGFRITYDFKQPTLAWVKLDTKPDELPRKQVRGGAPGGLDALGSLMKGVGKLLGMGPPPKPVPRGFFGFSADDRDNQVVIESVIVNAPADRAGIKQGDSIEKVNGKEITSLFNLKKALSDAKVNSQIKMTIRTGNSIRDVTIECGRGF